ncbi:hypothetical protein HG536_0A06710 [Torulaspora globosa]|uniref:Translocation protein SEC62 n=1 Tax=Torulaspora globosa TaxID=48254 RepID=A0A7G3ZBH0_9SACH|nr:uncharacterized protein HG536_0A06710 [Torulaspora globosa]QLL30856.1 hypothetical protein HG536_0A06710 [Torulaspora globosa]
MVEGGNAGGDISAIAKLLRHHRELKQRKGLFQSRQVDFFRYKRFVRALKSSEYAKKSQAQPELYPPVGTAEDDEAGARDVFISLIRAQLVVPCVKLHSAECKEHGLKPSKDFPTLILSNKAVLQPDEYYVWNYNPKTLTDYLIVVGVIAAILALVSYPLWPALMRRASYYVSLGALGLLGLFFILAIVRLVIYLFSLPFTKSKGGFWIFPNLFEDCGVVESFKPLYGYGEKECYSYLKKMKRNKRKLAKNKQIDEAEDKGLQH